MRAMDSYTTCYLLIGVLKRSLQSMQRLSLKGASTLCLIAFGEVNSNNEVAALKTSLAQSLLHLVDGRVAVI